MLTGLPAAVIAVPDGDAVAPPQLTRDAPRADVFHPVEEAPLLPLRDDRRATLAHRLHRGLGQRLHVDEPLGGDARLDVGMAALAGAHGVEVGLDFDEQSFLLEVGDDVVAALGAVLPNVGTGQLVHPGCVGHDVGGLQAVADADFVVGRVVRGGDFDRTGAELRIYRFVGDDGYAAAQPRQDGGLTDEALPAWVVGVDGDSGIAQDGLRAGGGHFDELGRALSPFAVAPLPW